MNGQADIMKLIFHFSNFAKAPKNYIFILMVNFTNNDSGNIKQVQKTENCLFLEAGIQCHNKWMPWSKGQSLLFSDVGRHIATTGDVGLLHVLNGKRLVRSIRCFHICQVNFSSNDSLEIWSRLKKLKITIVWKHNYSVIINGCPNVRTRASFWVRLVRSI